MVGSSKTMSQMPWNGRKVRFLMLHFLALDMVQPKYWDKTYS